MAIKPWPRSQSYLELKGFVGLSVLKDLLLTPWHQILEEIFRSFIGTMVDSGRVVLHVQRELTPF